MRFFIQICCQTRVVKESKIKLVIPGATTYEKLTDSVEKIKNSK